jgi:hypothetical protein
MAILAFSGALLLCNCLLWTPVQRYYLGAYLRCAGLAGGAALRTEIQWLYKSAPHKERELALDADVVPASSGGDRKVPMELSPAARQAGWIGLIEGPDEWFQTATLQTFLREQFYDGESFWRLLLTPLLLGTAMFLSVLAVRSALQSWLEHRRQELERTMWDPPPPSLLQRCCAKLDRVWFRLARFWKQRRSKTAAEPPRPGPVTAPPEPLTRLPQAALPIFGSTISSTIGAPNGKPKEGFAWDEHTGIE